ncbi:hypothetical protein L226DRAFT_577111 [Lentinus tigrinus ALCF2SS1-7]|nr:hypothetical protein L226DRAFT_577111 [Lentinus tigrinus ALCF2SS1-7]
MPAAKTTRTRTPSAKAASAAKVTPPNGGRSKVGKPTPAKATPARARKAAAAKPAPKTKT